MGVHMTIKTSVLFAVIFASGSVSAELYGEMRNRFFSAYLPSCFVLQRKDPLNKDLKDEILSKYCMCITSRAANLPEFTNDLVKKIEALEVPFPSTIITQVTPICQKTYAEYPAIVSPNISINTDGNGLFKDQVHRYTAYRRSIFSPDGKRLETKDIPIGQYQLDLEVSLNRSENIARDLESGRIYNLNRISTIPEINRLMGIDYMFSFSEMKDGYINFFSTSKKLILRHSNIADGTIIQTEYASSVALACKTLNIAKSRSNNEVLGKLIFEAFTIAIRSYAGASYSGGSFSGTNATGQSINGTYTQYNNSWLGTHYSNGLDAIFKGASSFSQIKEEMDKLGCVD
jgi:hypothetical protein